MTGWPERIEGVAWEDSLATADAVVVQIPNAGTSRFATGHPLRRISDGKRGRLLSIAARPEAAAAVRAMLAGGLPAGIHAARIITRDEEQTQLAWLASLGIEKLPPEY